MKKVLIATETLNRAAECLRCIAHPNRLKILNILESEPHCVQDITDALGVSQSVTSDHLRLLEAKGILKSERKGRRVYYSLAIPQLLTILTCIRQNDFERKL